MILAQATVQRLDRVGGVDHLAEPLDQLFILGDVISDARFARAESGPGESASFRKLGAGEVLPRANNIRPQS